ncbi:MAG TPA: hypothetical protein VE960_03345, partial [bacterium]|nr:hypothetical protein [bacterium]
MSIARPRVPIPGVAALVACSILLSGCSDSSTGPSEAQYPDPTSPEVVLSNFGRAYNERNVGEFLNCLPEDFRFYFTEHDQQQWPELPPWFYKSDERQVHENMFGDDWGVERIVLSITPASVETIPGTDPRLAARDVVVIRAMMDLRISMSDDLTFLATGHQDFHFREVVEPDGRAGRALWEMFEWYDLEDESNDDGRVEAGWGGIKHYFLESLSEPSRRTSPAEVIEQLEAAYNAMNVIDYMDCLSEDFVFYPDERDVQDPELDIPPEWYRSMEHIIHTNMFDPSGAVSSVQLTLMTADVFWDVQDPEDPLDDIYSHTEDVDLWVYTYGLTYVATGQSMFLLRVARDEQGPYGEPMWE